ncbi:membrane protein [Sphingomonas bisphenolicum]|uniref:Membrane protein n=2 Tax=Alphaproteobacteria TaxID=28211 RepID=A0ABM7G1Q5_9SPHN|nr:membrane protein [Sphingomonas bisphenolicum]
MVLLGIAIIVAGFLLRFHPLLVILASAIVTGLAAGLDPLAILAAFGKAFNEARYVSIIWIVLPVVGLLEAHGLQERARGLIATMRGATVGRFLTFYLILRQMLAAVGLTSVAGHPQTVRPLVAPIAEAAAETQAGELDEDAREEIKAWAAATDNVGLFFGEDIFLAIGSILLIKGLLEQYGISLEPFQLSVWAIPTAIAALLIHGFRLWRLDKRLARIRAERAP